MASDSGWEERPQTALPCLLASSALLTCLSFPQSSSSHFWRRCRLRRSWRTLRLPELGDLEPVFPQSPGHHPWHGCASRHPRLLVHSQTEGLQQPPRNLLMQSEEVEVSSGEQLGCGK